MAVASLLVDAVLTLLTVLVAMNITGDRQLWVWWGDNGDTGLGTSLTIASSLFWRCQHHHQAEW